MTDAIETARLTKRFRRADAVADLDLRVPAQSIFALIGPNGAGKTTTIKLLMNLVRPTSGHATVLGTDSRRLGVQEFQRIGHVSENQRLPLSMTPDPLAHSLRSHRPGRPRADVRHRLSMALVLLPTPARSARLGVQS
jgi:ABC-2 type transport system ATP-binding protein